MLNEYFDNSDELSNALDSLRELEQNVSEAIIQRRSSERWQVATLVTVRPGNSSERDTIAIKGVTGDVSNGGCLVLLPRPMLSGDVFWLDFSEGELREIGSVFGRCMRCRYISEGYFETGFRFFNNVDIACVLD